MHWAEVVFLAYLLSLVIALVVGVVSCLPRQLVSPEVGMSAGVYLVIGGIMLKPITNSVIEVLAQQ